MAAIAAYAGGHRPLLGDGVCGYFVKPDEKCP